MNEAIKAIMNANDVSENEAREMAADALEEISNGNWDALYDIGIEDDYIFDLI